MWWWWRRKKFRRELAADSGHADGAGLAKAGGLAGLAGVRVADGLSGAACRRLEISPLLSPSYLPDSEGTLACTMSAASNSAEPGDGGLSPLPGVVGVTAPRPPRSEPMCVRRCLLRGPPRPFVARIRSPTLLPPAPLSGSLPMTLRFLSIIFRCRRSTRASSRLSSSRMGSSSTASRSSRRTSASRTPTRRRTFSSCSRAGRNSRRT